MKKVLLVALITIVLLTLFVSCGNKISEENAISIAKELVEASYEINNIYYGSGLSYDTIYTYLIDYYKDVDTDIETPIYLPISDDCKYTTISEIKDATSKVYSEDYCNDLFVLGFEGLTTDAGTIYPKYINSTEFNKLSVRYDETPLITKTTKYDLSSIKIVKITQDTIYFKITEEATDNKQPLTINLTLVKNYDNNIEVWRLDSPTY